MIERTSFTSLALAAMLAVPCSQASAQHEVALHAGGGAVRAFGRTGVYGTIGLLPLTLSSGERVTVRVGASGWMGWVPLGTGSITRRLLAGGPLVDLSTGPNSGIGFFAQAQLQRIQSKAEFLTLSDGSPPPPREDRSGTRSGWAYGGTVGVHLPLGDETGMRLGLGILHQTIFPGQHQAIWRLGVALTLGY